MSGPTALAWHCIRQRGCTATRDWMPCSTRDARLCMLGFPVLSSTVTAPGIVRAELMYADVDSARKAHLCTVPGSTWRADLRAARWRRLLLVGGRARTTRALLKPRAPSSPARALRNIAVPLFWLAALAELATGHLACRPAQTPCGVVSGTRPGTVWLRASCWFLHRDVLLSGPRLETGRG